MFWFVRRALRALRGPLRRPLEPLLWLAAALSAKETWAIPARSTRLIGAGAGTSTRSSVRNTNTRRIKSGAPFLIILGLQARLDGTRWQVVPAYLATVSCTSVSALGKLPGISIPTAVCRLVSVFGVFGSLLSTAAGVFAPVFPMPKPTGPYRVGKTTRLWVDKARRSWLLRTKRKTGTQQLPEHRAMMANIWYPAVDRGGGGDLGKDGGADGERNDGIDGESNDPINSSSPKSPKSPKQPPWPMDTDVTFAAMASSETNRGQSRPINPINAKTQRHIAKFEKRKRDALLSGKKRRAHWLDPLLASTLAESFFLPAWIVDYFRLVKMDALEDAVVAEPPSSPMGSGFGSSASTPIGSGSHEDPQTTSVGFPVVLFSHSFTGVKEQNSALLQELASWGHVVVAVDHPHDAALVLYPDGSTADFRGYDMPKEHEPRNWWRFRHEHARWRALDLAHALERVVDASFDQTHPLCGKIDLTRISVVGHSFGGAAAVMLAQMDPRVTSVVALDPWMWPLGRESSLLGCPCPLLVFEAPEFMWNRDIFCVTNGECSSLMCAATAPQAVTGSASHGETKKAHGASGREGSFAVSRDACQETSQSERAAGTGDATVTVTGVGASTGPSSFQTAFGATADTLATEDTADTFPDSTRSQTASPFHDFPRDDEESTRGSSSFAKSTTSSELTEDQTKSPPGFVGNAIDGHAGVGYYNEDGYYYTSNPPSSPTTHKQSAYFRPQHPRNGSGDNLASMTSLNSHGSFTSLRSVHSVASVASLVSQGSGNWDAGEEASGDTAERTRMGKQSGVGGKKQNEPVPPTAEEEAAAAVASYVSGRPPRDPRSSFSYSSQQVGLAGGVLHDPCTGNQSFVSVDTDVPLQRQHESWSNVLDAVNQHGDPDRDGSAEPFTRVGSAGSLTKPVGFRRHPGSNRGGTHGSVASFQGGAGSVTSTGYETHSQRDPSGVAFKAVLANTMHFDFTDIAMVAPLATTLFGVVGVGGREVHDITSAATLRFLRMFNHPRDPDHSNPNAKELEKLRAALLSTTPVADVVAASEFGFTGGLCFGSGGSGEWVGNGVVVADTPGTGSNPTETETETQNKSSPAKQKLLNLPRRPSLPKLKVGGMGHPAATHRGVRGVLGGNGFGAKKRRKEWRKSFDATHLPENWMDLDGIPSEDEEGEGDAEKEKETEDGDSREGPTGFSKFAPRESKWGSGSLLEENTAANANATRPNKKTPYAQLPTPRVENALAVSVPGKSKVTEVKPKIVRWVKSHEWALRPDRQFDDAQRREMRWLLHECSKLQVTIQPSDFVAMFPSFDSAAVKNAALRELTSSEKFANPKPLVWLEQMRIPGDIPRHTRYGGNHHGVPDEELEGGE